MHGKGEGAGKRVRGMADMAEATIEFDEERNLFGRKFNDIRRHENEEAKGIKDNGYSKEEKITIHRKEEKKTKKEKGVGRPAGQEWIEVRTSSRCCQDRIGCQTLGPKAPGGFSPMGVDFFGSSTRA